MLAILFDRKIDDICCYSGIKSLLELSVLNGTLKEHFFCELESLGIDNIIILNESNFSSELKKVNEDKCFFFFQIHILSF